MTAAFAANRESRLLEHTELIALYSCSQPKCGSACPPEYRCSLGRQERNERRDPLVVLAGPRPDYCNGRSPGSYSLALPRQDHTHSRPLFSVSVAATANLPAASGCPASGRHSDYGGSTRAGHRCVCIA
eukprot:scaffold1312_cov393-Prasinococcus_capsulatus_cf.AAC.16